MNSNNEMRKPHSAEYFGEYRDYWWNPEFLELMAKRLQLAKAQTVLDVGCGIGHWGQLLAPILSERAQITGIDREEAWVTRASERANSRGLGQRYSYQKGDATNLPFGDGEFDLVTCQTVLIHLKDPKVALREMMRVLKPGGRLLIAEPNNFANRAILDSSSEQLSVDEILDRLKFGLIIERGKQALGLGFNSVGDLIPGYLAELGAQDVRVYLSDKTNPLIPPYSTKEQQVHIQQLRDWVERGFIGWNRQEALEYFVAGGGEVSEFEHYLKLLTRDQIETLKAIDEGTFHSAGGCVSYLIGAQKPMN